MKFLKYILIPLTGLILLACKPDNTPQPKLLEEQRNALDKAKDVSNAVEQQAQELHQKVEKQSQ
jgi:hypothetical protein